MEHFNFIDNINSYRPSESFLAMIDKDVVSKAELLEELYNKLQLPDYFGFNWDALFDCLTDFHWINEKRIVLIHEKLPLLSIDELKVYLRILVEAIDSWKNDKEHHFEVVFPKQIKDTVQQLI